MGIVREPSFWSFITSPPSLKRPFSRIGLEMLLAEVTSPRDCFPRVAPPRGWVCSARVCSAAQKGFRPTRNPGTCCCKVPPAVPFTARVSAGRKPPSGPPAIRDGPSMCQPRQVSLPARSGCKSLRSVWVVCGGRAAKHWPQADECAPLSGLLLPTNRQANFMHVRILGSNQYP